MSQLALHAFHIAITESVDNIFAGCLETA